MNVPTNQTEKEKERERKREEEEKGDNKRFNQSMAIPGVDTQHLND